MKINNGVLTAVAAASLIALTACTPSKDKPVAVAPASTAPASTAPASSDPDYIDPAYIDPNVAAEAAGPTATPSTPEQAAAIRSLLDSAPAASRRVRAAEAGGAGAELADGRWPGHITWLNGAQSLSFELVEILVGDQARTQWKKNWPASSLDGAPNGYVIVDGIERRRTLYVAEQVSLQVVEDGETKTIAPKDIPGYLGDFMERSLDFPNALFWLTVEGGKVTAMEEQYQP